LDVIFDDNFLDDPALDGGWVFNGNSAWVAAPGDAPDCADEVTGDANPQLHDPVGFPCTVYSEGRLEDMGIDPEDFGGYILATQGANSQGGNAFRSEKAEYDNFKLTVVVEMRDGTALGRPADGMCVIVVGGDEPPNRVGTGGGGMGAPCVGATDQEPMLAWEFDNWNCNNGDNGNDNHVGFAYSSNGFPCTDAVPPQVFVPITPLLHTKEGPTDLDGDGIIDQAPANRAELVVFAQRCGTTLTVAADMNFLDQGINLGRVFTHVVPDFDPFEGYLGVTGSTGGANQAHILHSAKLEELPDDFCLQPPAAADREISPAVGRGVNDACGDFQDGDDLTVDITLRDVREENDCCPAAGGVNITENLPAGWTASNPSDGGTVSNGGSTITWSIAQADVANGKSVSYTATADDSGAQFVNFNGELVEDVAGSLPILISGESRARLDTPFDACGAITCWNTLGPYIQTGGNNPGVENLREDYLTDGETTEEDFFFFPGATIATNFGNGILPAEEGTAASTGLFDTNQAHINPGGVPTVAPYNDTDGFININDDFYAGNPDNCMSYGVIYLHNDLGEPMEVAGAFSSDDSIQVILNDEEIWANSVARGGQSACNIAGNVDRTVDLLFPEFAPTFILETGENKLVVKTFEGGGGFNWSVRLEDPITGEAITEEIRASKYPEGICPVPPALFTRAVDTGSEAGLEHALVPKWDPDTTYGVEINITDVRPANSRASCPDAAGEVTIVETVPAGWTAANPSNGGALSNENRTITWVIDLTDGGGGGGGPGAPDQLTYEVTSGEGQGTATFGGKVRETGNVVGFAVSGVSSLSNPTDITDLGFFKNWLLLGPINQPTGFGFGAAPSEANMRKDWLQDGFDTFETEIEPVAGDEVQPNFAGALAGEEESPGTGVEAGRGDAEGLVNPKADEDIATWYAWADGDDTIAYEDYVGFDHNSNMVYAFTYFVLDDDRDVQIGVGSDDAIQVFLNGAEIHLNSVARGSGGANVIQDTIPADGSLISLDGGVVHTLMVKVWEGGGGHNFRLRLQDDLGIEITEGISVCHSPECGGDLPDPEVCDDGVDNDGDGDVDCDDSDCENDEVACPDGPGFLRGDTDGNGNLLLNDSILIFAWLFQGGVEPGCVAAADASGQGQVNLTSGIYGLNFLFTGGGPPPAPFPECAVSTRQSDIDLGCSEPHCP